MNKTIKPLILSIIFVLIFLNLKSQNKNLFLKFEYVNSESKILKYRLLPPLVNIFDCKKASQKYPLVIFLHGAGERGFDNEKQLIHGVNLFLEDKNRIDFPCFVLAPQCPKDKRWVEVSWKLDKHNMPEQISEPLGLTVELIEGLIKQLPIDTNRIYVTGLSMGGFGTWDLISRYPEKFAGAIPICGGGDENQAKRIKNIPIWAFHGSNDKVVKVSRTRNMINAIKKQGGTPKYTEFPKTGHFAWGKAYKQKGLLDWLFSKSLKK